MTGVVIVGGGLAGVRTAQALRDLGHTGPIRVLSEEAEPPYDRPPLSKEYLLGQRDDIRLGDCGEVTLDSRVVGVDLATRTLHLAGGRETGYDRLVVATGARPRRLPELPASPRVHYLRTAADSRRLRQALIEGSHVVVIGAGFIGLEVASAARLRGCRVTVVEAAPYPLATIIGAEPAAWLRDWHAARGIAFRCGTTVLTAADGHLRLADGTELTADAVVVGVGVVRDIGWLAAAGGLETHHGLVCDGAGRTSSPEVFGAGDIVCRHDGDCSPIAHWTAASDSAARAAAALLGVESPAPPDDGFFWSNQAELKLQFAGSVPPEAVAEVAAGTFESGRFAVHYTVDGRLTGVLAANSPRDFLRGRVALRTEVLA